MSDATFVREAGLTEVIDLVRNAESPAIGRILDQISVWSGPFRVHDGDLEIEGNFTVDPTPTLVWGNLTVKGTLIDGREGGQTLLVVLGDLTADNVVVRSALGVSGTVHVYGTLVASIQETRRAASECVVVGGAIHVNTLVNAGHWFHLMGLVDAEAVFGHFEDVEHSGYEAAELFESEYIDATSGAHGALDVPKVIAGLVAGKRVTKDAPTTRRRALFAALETLDERSAITLEDAGISEIPEEVFHAPNLRKLVLDFNEIYALPPRIRELKSLKDLSLDDAPLRALPDEIGELTNLEVLSLRFVKLKRLPPTFAALKNLRELYLTFSSLDGFPLELLELPRLEKVSLWHCTDDPDKLEAFIAHLSTMPSLRLLALCQGEIRSMPENLDQLAGLEELQIVDQRCSEAEIARIREVLPNVRLKTTA
ncbi:MAG: hypothetical protein R3E66_14400 [bacterium]